MNTTEPKCQMKQYTLSNFTLQNIPNNSIDILEDAQNTEGDFVVEEQPKKKQRVLIRIALA